MNYNYCFCFFVIFFSIKFSNKLKSKLVSTKTGFAPKFLTTSEVDTHECAVVIISSFFFIFILFKANNKASVPELQVIQNFELTFLEKTFSNSLTFSPLTEVCVFI